MHGQIQKFTKHDLWAHNIIEGLVKIETQGLAFFVRSKAQMKSTREVSGSVKFGHLLHEPHI